MGSIDEVPWDVYREIHKAMRFALFGVATMAGHTDAADDAALQRLVAEWGDVMMVLNGHHGHEDEFCDALVERHAPALREELEAAHRVADAAIASLDAEMKDLATTPAGTARWTKLRAFYLDLADFTALYINHLRFEEDEVMPTLNTSMTDSELEDLTNAIRMSVPPPEMCIFIRYMAPSMNFSERRDMLVGMKAAPPEIFEMFRDATEKCLSADDYRAVAVAGGFA